MFNNGTIKKTELVNTRQILFDVSNQKSVSVIISKDITTTQTVDGRKMVMAGTPIAGNLQARKTPMTAPASGSKVVGVLLHDVDVTDGDANASLLIWGFVNLDRVDTTTKALLTAQETDLDGKVWLLTDN